MATITVILTTTGSGTWTVPAGVTSIDVECWGAGATADTSFFSGGGGAYSKGTRTVTAGSGISYFVGATGAKAAAGQDTWFVSSSTIMAKGAAAYAGGIPQGGAAASGFGTVKYSGGNGQNNGGSGGGAAASPTGNGGSPTGGSATGGSSPGAGAGGSTGITGTANDNGGGGGGGGAFSSGAAGAGGAPGGGGGSAYGGAAGAGARGQIRITYEEAASDPTFGTTTSNSTGWGLAVAGMALTRFTVPEAALITKVTANLPTSVAATLARAVIYADNSGSPGARIGFSDNVSVATGLLDFPFTTQPTLSPGYVWIGVQANGEFLLARNTANMGIRFRAETWNVSAPPATWSGTSYESDAGLALLTTYTAVVVPTPDITATLNGVTKKPVASLSGSVSKTATLNTTTKRPVAALTGTVAKTASLNTSTKPPVAAFMGTVAKSAVLDTVTKKPVGGLFGTVGPGTPVYGREHYHSAISGTDVFTSASWGSACPLTFTPATSGDFVVWWSLEMVNRSTVLNDGKCRITADGVAKAEFNIEYRTIATEIGSYGGFFAVSAVAGVPTTVDIEIAAEVAGDNIHVRNRALTVLKLGAGDAFAENLTRTAVTVGTSGWEDVCSLTFTPDAGDYLVIGHSMTENYAATPPVYATLAFDGVVDVSSRVATAGHAEIVGPPPNRVPLWKQWKRTVAASGVSRTVQYQLHSHNSGDTVYGSESRLLVLRLADFDAAYYAHLATLTSVSGDTPTSVLSMTPTVSANPHLVIGSAYVTATSNINDLVYAQTTVEGVPISSPIIKPYSTTSSRGQMLGHASLVTPTAGTNTISFDISTGVGGTVIARPGSVISVLDLGGAPPPSGAIGTLDTTTKKPVGGLFGTVAKSASLQASTKRPTASLSGVVAKSAVLNTTTKKPSGGLAGTVSKTALLSTVTKKPTGGLNGIVAKQGVLNTTTKRPVAALVGSVSKVAILSTITRKPQASFAGTVAKSATLNAVTKKATAQFSGTVSAPLAINTTPPIIAGSPQLGQILTMAPGVWDIGSATLISTAHEWYVGEIATGRTGPTFAISSPEMMSEEVTVRETITTAGTSVAVSAPITVEPAVHHIFRGSITGVPASASGWTNSERIIAADGLSASFANVSGAGVSSPVLNASFDFTAFDLPHGSSIDGIELRTMRSGSAAGQIADEALTLTVNGSTSSELASAASWPTVLGEAVYGGSTDLLGLSPVALVPSDGLEIALDLQAINGASSTANIDSISIKLFYSVPVLNGVGWPVNVVPPLIAGVATPGSTVTVTSLGVWEPEPIPVWYYKFLFLDGPDPETAAIIGYDYSDDPTYQVPAMALRYPDGGGAVSTVGRYLVAAVINDEAPEDQAGYSNALMVEATNAATLNAVTKKAIGGLTGTVAKQATLNTVTKKPIGGLSARTVARATLNTVTKKPVGGMVGTVAVQASLDTVTKKPTGGLSGLLIGHVATLNAVTKKPIGGLSGFIVPSDIRGSLNTTTKRPTASLTGAVMASDCPTDRVVVFEREVRTGRFKAEHRTVVFDPETRTVRFPK